MAEHQLPKLNTRVRFPSSAPRNAWSQGRTGFHGSCVTTQYPGGTSGHIHGRLTVSARFLAADAARWTELDRSVRDYLAWSYVRANADGALGLTAAQRSQAEEHRVRADHTVRDQLAGTFHWALVPQNQPLLRQPPDRCANQSAN